MSAKYKSPSFLLPNELNTSANTANDTGVNSLYSMDFDGTEYITAGLLSEYISLSAPTTLTVSAWIKTTDSGTSRGIVSSASYSNGLNLALYNGEVSFGVGGGTATATTTTANVNDGNWHHIVGTYDSEGDASGNTLYIYVDGIQKASNTGNRGVYAFSDYPLFIGASGVGSSTYFPFIGKIDEVAIFNRVLNTTEIAALYGGTSPNIYPSNLMATNLNPVAYYPLGEQAQNTGYLGNEITNGWQFPNGVLQDYVMDFNGSTDFIEIPKSNALDFVNTDFSISIWLNPDVSHNGLVLMNYNGSDGWGVYYQSGSIRFYDAPVWTTVTTISTGQWSHILIVGDYTGSNLLCYKNGIEVYNSSHTFSITDPDGPVFIGSERGTGFFFNGKLSNIALWESNQSANIANIYNNGSPQTSYTVSPQNWWKLNADSVYTPSAPNYTTALNFNGSSRVSAPLNNVFNSATQSTISFWAKKSSSSNEIVLGAGTAETNSIYILWYSNGYVYFGTRATGAPTFNINEFFSGSDKLNKWHHFVGVYNAGTASLYINGSLASGPTSGGPSSLGSNIDSTFAIGRLGDVTTYNSTGEMSNVAIFNSALTASQVSTLFNFGTPQTAISFSPVGWWKLDNTTTGIQDSSGSGNNGTNNGTTQVNTSVAVVPSWKIPSALPITTTPNYTTALNFDSASSDYIDVGNDVSLKPTSAYSLSGWFKLNNLTGTKTIISNDNNNGYLLLVSGSTLVAYHWDSAFRTINSNTTLLADTWYHFAITWDSSNTTGTLYINGQYDNQSTIFGQITYIASDPVYIGTYGPSLYFNGELSNVQVFNTALPATGSNSVETLYNNGSPLTSMSGFTSLQGWWKLDTGGSTITDSAGSNNGANSNPGATQVTSDVLAPQPVNGVSTTLPSTALQQSDLQFDSPYSNYSLNFDGSGDYIDCGTISQIPSATALTVSCWLNANSITTNQVVWADDSSTYIFSFEFAGTVNKMYFEYAPGYAAIDLNSVITVGSWHNVVMVYDASGSANTDKIKFYIDGVDKSSSMTYTGTIPSSLSASIGDFLIGYGTAYSKYFNGNIDETSIFNYSLSEAQVLEIYNNGRPKDLSTFSGTAPISWWRLGENAYFDNNSFIVPNSISGAPNGTGSGTINTMISADAPGTYANGIGTNLDIIDRVGDAALSTSNSQSYNMIPSDKSPYVPGYVGNQIANNFSMTFDSASNTYFNAGNPTELQITGQLSISLWFKTSTSSGVRLVSKDDGSSNRCYGAYINAGQLGFFIFKNNVFNSVLSNISNSNDNNWHNAVFINNGTSLSIYIDGVLRTSTNTAGGTIDNDVVDFEIGRRQDNTQYFDGQIDEVAIFDTALNAGQIYNDIYQPTATGTNQTADIANNPNLPNPVAWYRMGD